MQRLIYESAWDKTIAEQDRKMIEEIFNETSEENGQNVAFPLIRSAMNHKGDLLVTCLIHNFGSEPFVIQDTVFTYKEDGELIAELAFTIPQVQLPPETSMPWTFIFPKALIHKEPVHTGGKLDFK
ncbi:SLAP domain-containing protein [Fictibacillus solisalsi]|uniref:SLAP domain-containing protein n=1 Tax=Fictibacillus solisalsi TaxID=459525 RepID=A0A1H0BA73_9BACL|nr:SLAP domain-containing protein [Fictibacillus solisalsi]SDN42540.1 SLAP domain-containing protein [Fictibacillus solisalsi]